MQQLCKWREKKRLLCKRKKSIINKIHSTTDHMVECHLYFIIPYRNSYCVFYLRPLYKVYNHSLGWVGNLVFFQTYVGILLISQNSSLMKQLRFMRSGFVIGISAGFGVTAGAHRLWTHRAYKAKLPLQIILLVLYSAAGMVTKKNLNYCNYLPVEMEKN